MNLPASTDSMSEEISIRFVFSVILLCFGTSWYHACCRHSKMSPVYGVFHPVYMVLWCLCGISDGFVENHILFCVRGSYFSFVSVIISWIYVLSMGSLVVTLIPKFGIIFSVFHYVSWVHILVWLWGLFGRHVWVNRKYLKCDSKKYISILYFFFLLRVPKCADTLMFVLMCFICVLVELRFCLIYFLVDVKIPWFSEPANLIFVAFVYFTFWPGHFWIGGVLLQYWRYHRELNFVYRYRVNFGVIWLTDLRAWNALPVLWSSLCD